MQSSSYSLYWIRKGVKEEQERKEQLPSSWLRLIGKEDSRHLESSLCLLVWCWWAWWMLFVETCEDLVHLSKHSIWFGLNCVDVEDGSRKSSSRSSLSSHSIVIKEMAELPPAKPIRMSRTTKDVLSGEKPEANSHPELVLRAERSHLLSSSSLLLWLSTFSGLDRNNWWYSSGHGRSAFWSPQSAHTDGSSRDLYRLELLETLFSFRCSFDDRLWSSTLYFFLSFWNLRSSRLCQTGLRKGRSSCFLQGEKGKTKVLIFLVFCDSSSLFSTSLPIPLSIHRELWHLWSVLELASRFNSVSWRDWRESSAPWTSRLEGRQIWLVLNCTLPEPLLELRIL